MAADRSTAELERFLAERADHLLRTELRQPQDATGDVDLRDALARGHGERVWSGSPLNSGRPPD